MEFISRLTNEQKERYVILQEALTKNFLNLRLDSDVCLDYILYNKRNLSEIIHLVAKGKYLHEYCDFKTGFEVAQKLRSQQMKKQDFLNLLESCVLNTTDSKQYPNQWPWISESFASRF